MGEILELLFPREDNLEVITWNKSIRNSIEGVPLFSSAYYSLSHMKVILRAKENNDLQARKILAKAIAIHIDCPSILIPIPSSSASIRRRGYDHSHLLALEVAKMSKSTATAALRVNRRVKDQTKLNHRERFTNIRGSYSLLTGNLNGNSIVLIDDLVTTGASVLEALRVLRGAELTPIRAISACIATHHLPNTISP